MGGPGSPGFAAPRGEDWIVRRFTEIETRIRENAAARTTEQTAIGQGGLRSVDFDGTGPDNPGTTGWMIGRTPGETSWLIMNGRLIIAGDTSIAGLLDIVGQLTVTGPTTLAGDLTISGDTTVTGDLDVTGPMTVGGALAVTGDAVFSGDLAVPNGSITNDALANPITGRIAATVTASAWTVSTSPVTTASTSIAVPAGFSRALVFATAAMHFQDSAPNGGWLRAVIAGNAGAEMGGLANLNLGQTAIHGAELTGLSGGTIVLDVQVRASAASSVTTGRIAQIGGYALFFRS